MRRLWLTRLVLAAALLSSTWWAGAGTGPSEPAAERLRCAERLPADHRPDAELVAELDRLVQRRFLTYDEFGIRRIRWERQHNDYRMEFRPENAEEMAVVCELERRGRHLELLIAGRGVLGYSAVLPEEPVAKESNGGTLSDPIRVAGDNRDDELPPRSILQAAAALAFRSSEAHLTEGGWAVDAFAVPAVRPACIGCHNGEPPPKERTKSPGPFPVLFSDAPRLALGDPIGVTLYVHRLLKNETVQ